MSSWGGGSSCTIRSLLLGDGVSPLSDHPACLSAAYDSADNEENAVWVCTARLKPFVRFNLHHTRLMEFADLTRILFSRAG